MSGIEIYLVKPGQAIKDGALVYGRDIYDKEDAKADALKRLKLDPSLAKIVYYEIRDDGRFKTLYSHVNEDIREAVKPVRRGGGGPDRAVGPKKKAPEKLTFTQKLMKGLGLK